MKSLVLFLVFICSFYGFAMAQSIYQPTSYWDNFQIRTLTMDEGMPGEQVYYALEDSLGFIWIANIYGLVRYDGLSLKTFDNGYKGGTLYELHINESGNLLIPSIGQGLYEFDGGKFSQYKDELPTESGMVKSMVFATDGLSYLGMYGDGIAIFDGQKVIKHIIEENGLISNEVWKVIEDRNGRIWVGTNYGLSIIENGSITNFTDENGLPYAKIRGLTEMSNGDVWVGTDKEGIVIFRNQKPYKYLHTNDGLSGLFPQYFAEHPFDGSIWIAHHGNGIDVYRDGIIENLSAKNGLLSDYLTFIGFSKDGTAYIGHETGLSVIQKKMVQTFDENVEGIIQSAMVTVNEDVHQTTWLGTDGTGFNYFKDNKWGVIEFPTQFTNGYASTSAIDRDGNIWFASQGNGIVKVEGTKVVQHFSVSDGLLDDFARGIAFDSENNVWLGSNQGLNVIRDNGNIIETITTENGLANNFSMVMYADSKDGIWHGSYGGGITYIKDNQFNVFDTTNGLGSNVVFSIIEDKENRILIGSGGIGISYYKNGIMYLFGAEHGFPSANISGMDVDENGRIWCASNNGIFAFNPLQLDEILNGEREQIEFIQLSREDGLSSMIYETGNGKTVKTLSNGEILFASVNGADILHPDNIQFNTKGFFPYIDNFIVDENALDKSNLRDLNPDDQKIEISYSALNIQSPKKTKFRIKLDGIDDNWVYVEERTTAYYDFLPDGEYTFSVSAIGPDGMWSPKTASINFSVLPPFYKTWWFIALYLIAFGGVIAGGIRIYYRAKVSALNRELAYQQRIHLERERISRDLHDNVGSQITNLITGLEISQLHFQKNEKDKGIDLIADLDADARAAMTELRETIWLIDKQEIVASIFKDHLKGYIHRQSRYLPKTKIEITTTSELGNVLKPAESLNLMRIVQEALNNTKKYAGADHFKINFEQLNGKFHLTIEDDGAGMDMKTSMNIGNGLGNMKARATEIGADFEIKSAPGEGTKIFITL